MNKPGEKKRRPSLEDLWNEFEVKAAKAQPRKEVFSLRLDSGLLDRVRELAKKNKRSVSELVRSWIVRGCTGEEVKSG